MSYFHPGFSLAFLPIVVLIYNIIPKKAKPLVLLIASFGFFFFVSKILIVFLLLSITSIYLVGLFLDKMNQKRDTLLEDKDVDKKAIKEKYKKYKKLIIIFGIIFNVSFLFVFKYLGFFGSIINSLLSVFKINFKFKIAKFIAPIGISFYTLQALSYIIDVYNEKVKADKNYLRVALFLSFFPQIMEGPIARYSDTAEALYNRARVTYYNFCLGYQRIFYGFLKKYIIADRLNVVVKTIFENYTSYSGIPIIVGIISYTIMLYMEFSGTMDVVIGCGEIFNVKIPENFRQPFFAKNISEFWTRWHISLGAWFKNYIFYPVSLSKPMKKITTKMRKILGNHWGALVSGSIALFTVWALNGLWHGAGWTFLFFGLYQFIMILMGNIFDPLIQKICNILHINRQNIFYRIFQSVKMTMFVFLGELFFRAPTLNVAFGMIKRLITKFNLNSITNGELLTLGIDIYDYIIVLIFITVVFVISILKEKNINIREEISKKNIVIRWLLYYALILSIILFGAYGPGYVPVDPIYADF